MKIKFFFLKEPWNLFNTGKIKFLWRNCETFLIVHITTNAITVKIKLFIRHYVAYLGSRTTIQIEFFWRNRETFLIKHITQTQLKWKFKLFFKNELWKENEKTTLFKIVCGMVLVKVNKLYIRKQKSLCEHEYFAVKVIWERAKTS
jgi:hypothetical protein